MPACPRSPAGRRRFDERSAGFAERTGFLRMDPLIAFAGIGLIVCSIVALGVDDPGRRRRAIRTTT